MKKYVGGNMALISLFLLISAILSGCMTVATGVASVLSVGMFPDSDYIVFSVLESGYDKQQKIYDENPRRALQDKYGRFYFEPLKDGETGVVTVRHDDYDILKSSFSKGRAVLLPLFFLDSNGKAVPDWIQTEVAWRYMKNNMKLNLVSLDVSKKVWGRIVSTWGVVSANKNMFEGGTSVILNKTVYDLAIKEFDSVFDLIVFSPENMSRAVDSKNSAVYGYGGLMDASEFVNFSFSSMEYFRSLQNSGALRFYSLCGVANTSLGKRKRQFFSEIDLSRKAKLIDGKRAIEYNRVLKIQYDKALSSCAIGFRGLGMDGFESSNRLK